jgi:hypothetical protein
VTGKSNLHFFIKYSILPLVKLAVTPKYLEANNLLYHCEQLF